MAPPVGLVLGGVVGLLLGNPFPADTTKWSKLLLQVAVVGLGFGLDVREVLAHGWAALPATLVGIVATFALGWFVAKVLAPEPTAAFLVTTGTSICGGSAIAAMAPVIEADSEQTAVALATVFTLNAIALLLFPPLGVALHLTPEAFGTWAAIAIHDTSSVVGAAATFGDQALAVGTTVKLTRALWILPLVFVVGLVRRSTARPTPPWFLLGFLGAVLIRAGLPRLEPVWSSANDVARRLLVVSLFLIGAGLTRALLKRVGARPLAHGVILWIVVSAASLWAVTRGWMTVG